MQILRSMILALGGVALQASVGLSQNANDPSARLAEVLPAKVVEKVLEVIAKARAHDLPADALAQRALKFAAKGVAPAAIEASITEHFARMQSARDVLAAARGNKPQASEIEAGADAIRMGVSGAEVSALAKGAPSGRSLAVPLFVIGSLVDRGLPSDAALAKVLERMQARASDADLEAIVTSLPPQAAPGQARKPELTGQDRAAANRPANAGPPGSPPSPPSGTIPPVGPPSGVTPPLGPPAGVPPGTTPPVTRPPVTPPPPPGGRGGI